jgi:HSP20 family protein
MPTHEPRHPRPPRSKPTAVRTQPNVLDDVLSLVRALGGLAGGLSVGGQIGSAAEDAVRRAAADDPVSSVKEFSLPGGARGVYGLSIRVGLGGDGPVVNEFGNMKVTDEGVVVNEAREPLVDVFDEGEEILVVIELPGVAQGDIEVELAGDIISLSAQGPRHRYESETLLPAPVDPGSVQESYQNGYLQLRYRKAATGPGADRSTAEPDKRGDE